MRITRRVVRVSCGVACSTWQPLKQKGNFCDLKQVAHDIQIRVASLNLRDAKGKTVSFGKGLAGYVLGKSRMEWTAPASGIASNGTSAQGDTGAIEAVSSISSGK